MDVETPILTTAKLTRRIDELEDAVGGKADVFVSVKPHVVPTDPAHELQAQQLYNALTDAMEARYPARMHVFVNHFGQSADVITADFVQHTAIVIHEGVRMSLPLDQVPGFWLAEGYKLQAD